MDKKLLFLILIISVFFQFCSKKKAADYTGNFLGDIRGNKLSMLLKNDEKSKISGTIFDRNINFKVAGEVIDGKFSGTAIDTINKLEFIVNANWEKDTMNWNMQMVKPQKSQLIEIKFIKVFINKEEKGSGKNAVKKSQEELLKEVTNKSQPKKETSTNIYNPSFYGLWEVKRSDKTDGSEVFETNKYLYFNANGSVSKLVKQLIPLDGYKWFAVNDSMFMNSKINGRISNDNLGKYTITADVLKIEKQGKFIELQKVK